MKSDIMSVIFADETRCDEFVEMLRRARIEYTAHRRGNDGLFVVVCTCDVWIADPGNGIHVTPPQPWGTR